MVVSPFHPEEIPDVPAHQVLLKKFAEHGDKVAIVSSSQIKLLNGLKKIMFANNCVCSCYL